MSFLPRVTRKFDWRHTPREVSWGCPGMKERNDGTV